MSKIDDFEIIKKLGEGTFSSVYKIKRKTDDQEYAMKKIKMQNLSSKERKNSLNEIRFLASIESIYIVSYKEAIFDEDSQHLYLIMEYLAGGDLLNRLKYLKKKNRQLDENFIWLYLIQIVKGLKSLHDLNILHRDMKSANIFLSRDKLTAKVGDLNVSKVAKMGLLYTQTGTPYYASPEVWRDKPYDLKSDIWSLGCILYEMCTSNTPFKASDMEQLFKVVQKGTFEPIPSNYSTDLSQIIQQCLNVQAQKRPNCDQLLELPIIKQRIQQLQNLNLINKLEINYSLNNSLLQTFYLPDNLKGLNNFLPDKKYSSTHKEKEKKSDHQQQQSSSSLKQSQIHAQQDQGKHPQIILNNAQFNLYNNIQQQAMNVNLSQNTNNSALNKKSFNKQQNQNNNSKEEITVQLQQSQIQLAKNGQKQLINQLKPNNQKLRSITHNAPHVKGVDVTNIAGIGKQQIQTPIYHSQQNSQQTSLIYNSNQIHTSKRTNITDIKHSHGNILDSVFNNNNNISYNNNNHYISDNDNNVQNSNINILNEVQQQNRSRSIETITNAYKQKLPQLQKKNPEINLPAILQKNSLQNQATGKKSATNQNNINTTQQQLPQANNITSTNLHQQNNIIYNNNISKDSIQLLRQNGVQSRNENVSIDNRIQTENVQKLQTLQAKHYQRDMIASQSIQGKNSAMNKGLKIKFINQSNPNPISKKTEKLNILSATNENKIDYFSNNPEKRSNTSLMEVQKTNNVSPVYYNHQIIYE